MRRRFSLAIVPFALMAAAFVFAFLPSHLQAQSSCQTQSPPPAIGEPGFVGQAGYTFDHWSDAGTGGSRHYFQLMVKNLGSTPLTFDWKNADFFRRGVPTRFEARSQCRSDGNAPNVLRGVIMYGPNTQFPGPDGQFYDYQRRTSQSTSQLRSEIRWAALSERGDSYQIDLAITAIPSAESIKYLFDNYARPVDVEWPAILTSNVLAAAKQQNVPSFFRGNRIALPAGKATLAFQVSGSGQPTRIVAPLTVFTPDGTPLYRDTFAGFRFGANNQ